MNKRQFFIASNRLHWGAIQIAGLYLLIGGLWILFSDRVANRIALNQEMLTTISLYKGWGYVLITALLLYWLIRSHTATLRASQVQLQRVMDALPMFISYVDADRRYQFTNHTYKEWFDDQVEGKHVEEVLGKAGYKTASKYVDKVLSGETTSYETELVFQGNERFISVTYIPDIGVDGRVKGFFVMGLDRTTQKQSEEELRLWANAFEGCGHGIAIGDPHTNRIVVCNPAFAKLHKCRVEDIEGSAILSLYAPSDHEHVRRNVERADQIGHASFEARMIRKDGLTFPVQMDLVSVLGEDGELLHRVVTAQDISERQSFEEKLKASETKYRTLVEHLPVITYISEPDQQAGVTYISPQVETLGFDVDTWLDDPGLWFRQIHPDDQERVTAELQRFEAGAEFFRAEYRLILPNGEIRWLDDESVRVKDQSGKTILKQGFMLDITDRKQAEQENKSLARFPEENPNPILRATHEGKIIYANASSAPLLEDWQSQVGDYLPADWIKLIRELLATNSRKTIDIQCGDTTYSIMFVPILAGNYVNLYGRDITERNKAEEDLRNSQKQLAGIFNSAMDAIISTDANQRILIFNPAAEAMFRCPQAEAIGQPLERFIPERFREAHRKHVHNFGQTGVTSRAMKGSAVVFGRRNSGEEFPSEASISHIEVAGKKIYTVILRDVTERIRAEEVVRQSEERFASVFRSSPTPIVLTRLSDDKIMDVNEAFCQLFGYARSEIVGHTSLEISIAEPESRQKAVEQLKEKGAIRNLEQKARTHKGTPLDILNSIEIINVNGEPHALTTLIDITERKQAEEYLRRFELLSEHSRDIILFMRRDDGRILEANAATLKAYGYSRDELLELTVQDLRASETVSLTPAQMIQADTGGILFETVHRRKDGSTFPVEVSSQGATIGGVRTLISIVRDITERKRTEEQLEQSNRHLNEILESIQDDFYVLDREWNFVYASKLFTSKVGKEPKDFIGNNIWTIFPKQVGTVLDENFRAAMENRETRRFEIGGKDTAAWYRMTAFPSAEGITVLGTDVTKLKQTEDALRLKDQLLHLTSEMAKVGGWEFDAETGKGAWTDEVARIHDLDPAQETNVEIGLSFYAGESREQIEHAVREAIELAKPYDLELEMVTAKGNRKWVRTMALPILQDNKVVKVQGIFQDITERKQIEQALQTAHDELELKVQERTAALSEANALLQALMDNLPDHIYFKDTQSRFIRNSRSQATLLGLSNPSETTGKTDFDFFPHAAKAFAEEQEVMRSGKPLVDLEEWVVWPGGREMWVLTTKLPLRNSEGQTIGIFGISHDITERKRAEQAIRQLNADLEKQAEKLQLANKELEAFSYSVSHDLRAPLRAIDGYTRILVEDYESLLDAEGKRVCGIISREARRMGQLIDDLLAFSRLGRKQMYSSKIEMRALAVSVLNELIKEEDRARIDFQIGRLPSIFGDSSLLRQVWVNLLSNALKFTSRKEKAVIEVGSKQSRDETIYYVRDTGAGFEMEYANKLFGVFQRLHSESEFDGTGVGLAIVQRIIHRHGGRVWAEGEVDKGATFYFALPRKEHEHE